MEKFTHEMIETERRFQKFKWNNNKKEADYPEWTSDLLRFVKLDKFLHKFSKARRKLSKFRFIDWLKFRGKIVA